MARIGDIHPSRRRGTETRSVRVSLRRSGSRRFPQRLTGSTRVVVAYNAVIRFVQGGAGADTGASATRSALDAAAQGTCASTAAI